MYLLKALQQTNPEKRQLAPSCLPKLLSVIFTEICPHLPVWVKIGQCNDNLYEDVPTYIGLLWLIYLPLLPA